MRTVRVGTVIGLIAQLVLLSFLAWSVGLTSAGWVVGMTSGVVVNVTLASGFAGCGVRTLGPADRVTLARATLAGGVAALTADSLSGHASGSALVALSAAALALDAVDGWVARRTGTVSAVGARFDMEVDAYLIMVLSVYVAGETGAVWVLAIGAARYLYVAAGWVLPWLRGSLPARYWRKVVAATQGVVLTIAAADVLPGWLTSAALAASLALLAESFGQDVWWRWRHRSNATVRWANPADRGRVRAAAALAASVGALLLVWFALVAPNHFSALTPTGFLRIPLEGVLVVGLVLVLPPRARATVAVLVGVTLGVLTVLKIIDMGFFQTLDRPFNPVTDWSYLGPAVGVLGDSIGRTGAIVSVVAAAMLAVALIVVMPMSVLRLTRLAGRHRATSLRSVLAFGLVWVLCFMFGLQLVANSPIASTSAAAQAVDEVTSIRSGIADQDRFAQAAANDSFGIAPGAAPAAGESSPASPSAPSTSAPSPSPGTTDASVAATTSATVVPAASPASAVGTVAPSNALLSGLQGKDVIIAFIEAYGRVAVQDSTFSAQIDATLDAGTNALRAAGFSSKSAFLTSPTFGGLSWLAHATLQSGLWVDSQQRYDQLVSSERLTLTGAFKNAGWRTVADVPSNEKEWPEGTTFYHYDQIYDATNVAYAGPGFGYSSMPDQFIMAAFQQRELAQPHAPVMAEIDLVSSHWPWAPLPRMVDWGDVGDGSVFDEMPAEGQSSDTVWSDPELVKAAYGQSIDYSLNVLTSFVQNYGDENLVVIALGDHQPAAVVTGEGASHDVPITIIAHDPAVLSRISGWGWQDGMNPSPEAPVLPMDAFRDRFLTVYSGPPQPNPAIPR